MVLKIKNREKNPRKKILIYGLDGTGKSTYAEKYCKEHNLNAVVIDVDDTNYTSLDILDLRFPNDKQTYTIIKNTIKEIGNSDYDTLILDGVSSLLEMLTSKAKGQAKYSDRAMRWNDILFEIENTRKNIIFIGQIDCDMLWTEDYQPSKAIIKLNSLVNEKYQCFIDEKGNYEVEVKKFRTLEQVEAQATKKSSPFKTADTVETAETAQRQKAKKIIGELTSENKAVTLGNAKSRIGELVFSGELDIEEGNLIFKELEVLLNAD